MTNGALDKRRKLVRHRFLSLGGKVGFLTNLDAGSSIWTVSELTGYIKELFEIDYRLHDVEVVGEISNFVQARSGHLYFTLKDESSQLKCVMWRSMAQGVKFTPKDGDAIIARGRVSVYEASGVYQLYVERLQPSGRGSLAVAFERLKEMLAEEGLFDPEHKKPIPRAPKKIGIVTSADAAALQDILNVLQRRYPFVSVLIAPTLVQGDNAPPQIVRALEWLDGRDDIDTIIIARGGGSIEDLWAFNDERVARAIFTAHHPIISGIGHETDFTITDFVADLRAPTPSAAAELAVPDAGEYQSAIDLWYSRLIGEIQDQIQTKTWLLNTQMQSLRIISPRAAIDKNWQKLDTIQIRLETVIGRRLEQLISRLAVSRAELMSISPLATMSRGYAIVRHESGDIIRSSKQVAFGDKISVQVSEGDFNATVVEDRLEN